MVCWSVKGKGGLPSLSRALSCFQDRAQGFRRLTVRGVFRQVFHFMRIVKQIEQMSLSLPVGAVNRRATPDDHHWLASVALKHSEEIHHLGRLDGSGVNAEKDPPQADAPIPSSIKRTAFNRRFW